MPNFPNPFSGNVPEKKLTFNELIRAIRIDIAGELEAIHLYQAHADATDNELVKEVLLDIANEERVHVGELQRLLTILLPDEADLLAEGAAEVDAEAKKLGAKPAVGAEEAASGGQAPTIGSLKP
ncbi:MAG: Rubrerythrin [Chloroflexi bacterium]|nr:Rubrerythrin [Chloroflexota bacterium]